MTQWKGAGQTEVKLHGFFLCHMKYITVGIESVTWTGRKHVTGCLRLCLPGRLGDTTGEQNSICSTKNRICVPIFASLPEMATYSDTWTGLDQMVPRCAHSEGTPKKWSSTTLNNVRVWQITWTMPTSGVNVGMYEHCIGLQGKKWEKSL